MHTITLPCLLIHPMNPKNVESRKFESWNQGMQVELSSLERTSIWEIVDSPPNIKPIRHIWRYKIKFHVVGTVGRFKVRLMEKGYKRIEGMGYFDVYSFTAKMTITRLVIALTTTNN